MDSDKNDDIPQRPAWTLFFEGTLYQKYLQYMKNHDLSKVLNNGSTITNKNNPMLDPPVLNNETNWLPYDASKLENEAGYPDYNYPPSYGTYPAEANNGSNGSPPPYNYPARLTSTSSEKFLTESERKRRKRQTRGFICIGIMLLGAIAAATALIIHFVFITKKEQVYDGGTIHIPSPNSTSLFNKTLTQLTKRIEFSVNTLKIGQPGEIKCRLNGIRMWDSVYIRGRKLPHGRETPLTLTVMMDGSVCLTGNDTRITSSHSVSRTEKDPKLSNIEMILYIKNVRCEDEDTFYCGINGPVEEVEETVLSLSRAAEPQPTLVVPTQIIEDVEIFITAKWMAGFPKEIGELQWTKVPKGESKSLPLDESTIVQSVHNIPEKCEVEVTSHIKVVPTPDWNQTRIIVKPILHEKNTAAIKEVDAVILVVPANVCENQTADVNISHPYTCKHFVRCRPMDPPVVYNCPDNACFDSDRGECI